MVLSCLSLLHFFFGATADVDDDEQSQGKKKRREKREHLTTQEKKCWSLVGPELSFGVVWWVHTDRKKKLLPLLPRSLAVSPLTLSLPSLSFFWRKTGYSSERVSPLLCPFHPSKLKAKGGKE